MTVRALSISLDRLLGDCEKFLVVGSEGYAKWVLTGGSGASLFHFDDLAGALSLALAKARAVVTALPSYEQCRSQYEADPILKHGARLAGHWGSFDQFLEGVVRESGQRVGQGVKFDRLKADKALRITRRFYSRSRFDYEATARLLGVRLKPKKLILSNGIVVYRLNRKELNDRQPRVSQYFGKMRDTQLGFHNTELRIKLTITVDRSQEGAYWTANHEVRDKALAAFSLVGDAVQFVRGGGPVSIGDLELSGGFTRVGGSSMLPIPLFPSLDLATSDLPRIEAILGIIDGGDGDRVLERSVRRFLLGQRRPDLSDRLVDYVIAWESLLLTNKGDEISGELSYRFSVNGASLLATVGLEKDRISTQRRFATAYKVRSRLVHGGDTKTIAKLLWSGEFASNAQLCDYLEESYRRTILFLKNLTPAKRPYRDPRGWSYLLWGG